MKPRSLGARLTALLILASLLILGAASIAMDHRVDAELERRFRTSLLTQARALMAMADEADQDNAPEPTRNPTHTTVLGRDAFFYELACDGGLHLTSDPPLSWKPAGWPGQATIAPRYDNVQVGHRHVATLMVAFQPDSAGARGGDRCRALVANDRSRLDQTKLSIDWILIGGPLLAMLLTAMVVPLIVRHALRPLGRLGERMAEIGPDAPDRRLPAAGLRELDPLIERFNAVLGRMDEGLANERRFASGLAHETRTRLAELRSLCEVERRYPSGRSTTQLLEEIGSIGQELEATVTALLLLTRLVAGLEPPQRTEVPLVPWLRRRMDRAIAAAATRTPAVRFDAIDPAACWHTDPALLDVVVGNLLGNALAYAPEGSQVLVAVSTQAIAIENAAPDLTTVDLTCFGQRFWRKQMPHSAHAGLGLALACAAARALHLQLDFQLHDDRLSACVRAAPETGMAN